MQDEFKKKDMLQVEFKAPRGLLKESKSMMFSYLQVLLFNLLFCRVLEVLEVCKYQTKISWPLWVVLGKVGEY